MKRFLIHTDTVGMMATNCYFLTDQKDKSAIIIDPGDAGDYLNQKIMEYGIVPVLVLLTHGHFDHILGIADIKLTRNIPVYISPADNFLVKTAAASREYFLNVKTVPAPDVSFFTNTVDVKIMDRFGLTVIKTPGHTPGSLCYYSQKENFIFTGDTIFKDGAVGRTDFSYSSEKDLYKSLKTLMKLPDKTIIYPGHGEPSTIGKERVR